MLGRICKSLPDAEGARFHMSDSVWEKTADDAFVPDENFLDTVKTAYDAEVFGAPFDETTCRDINRLVEQETDGMITEILDQIPELMTFADKLEKATLSTIESGHVPGECGGV